MVGPASGIANWVIAGIVVVALILVANVWFKPGPEVQQTGKILIGAAIVIVLIRVFLWFVGVW